MAYSNGTLRGAIFFSFAILASMPAFAEWGSTHTPSPMPPPAPAPAAPTPEPVCGTPPAIVIPPGTVVPVAYVPPIPAPPAPPPPPCIHSLEMEQMLTCTGRTLSVPRYACGELLITPAMKAKGASDAELTEGVVRMNHCLAVSGHCEAHGDRSGGDELEAEVNRASQEEQNLASMSRFHYSVTSLQMEKSRDDMAVVSRKAGFRRQIVAQHMIYQTRAHEKFHEDGEGVDLVAKFAGDKEAQELTRLAASLEKMRLHFQAAGDKDSEANSGAFEAEAQMEIANLDRMGCELDQMARTDRERENKTRPLIGLPGLGGKKDPGFGKSASGFGLSNITGEIGAIPQAIPLKREGASPGAGEASHISGLSNGQLRGEGPGARELASVSEQQRSAGETEVKAESTELLSSSFFSITGNLASTGKLSRLAAAREHQTTEAASEETLERTIFQRVHGAYEKRQRFFGSLSGETQTIQMAATLQK